MKRDGSASADGAMSAEWRRLELLADRLLHERRGEPTPENLLADLSRASEEVRRARGNGSAWSALDLDLLDDIDVDVLACLIAPEARPRLGWVFQSLQPHNPEPYPCAALIQDLLALNDEEAAALYATISADGRLRRYRLVETTGGSPFEPLRPRAGVSARILHRPMAPSEPPGTRWVPERATWDELVVDGAVRAALVEFLFWIREREKVQGEWKGRPWGGPIALFSGPSGTGKSFAATVIATELGWPLFRADLSRLLSRWVGESERRLSRLLDACHGEPLVLLFDEADSLFGRRGETRDARDRWANLEVSHLLSIIEWYQGPCILTTNYRRNLDPAFYRRFTTVIDFSRPGPAERLRLWRMYLPPAAPFDPDLDLESIARLPLTGSQIRNCALHAGCLAAGRNTVIGPAQMALAVWRELGKDGRTLNPDDLGPLAGHAPLEVA